MKRCFEGEQMIRKEKRNTILKQKKKKTTKRKEDGKGKFLLKCRRKTL